MPKSTAYLSVMRQETTFSCALRNEDKGPNTFDACIRLNNIAAKPGHLSSSSQASKASYPREAMSDWFCGGTELVQASIEAAIQILSFVKYSGKNSKLKCINGMLIVLQSLK